MFLDVPHNSARYVSTIFTVSGDSLFKDHDHEAYYYAAALALYKYQTLINGQRIGARNFVKVRWHITQLFKWICHGNMDVPPPNSRKAESYASKLIQSLTADERRYVKVFEKCQEIVNEVGLPSDDALKRARFSNELATAARRHLESSSSRNAKAKRRRA
jgi:hypothetical protein